jgi:hypothetical protein
MEALPSLTLRHLLGFHSSLALQANNPFDVLLSLGGRVWLFMTFHVPIMELYFLDMAWLNIKNIVRLIGFSLQVALHVLLCFF